MFLQKVAILLLSFCVVSRKIIFNLTKFKEGKWLPHCLQTNKWSLSITLVSWTKSSPAFSLGFIFPPWCCLAFIYFQLRLMLHSSSPNKITCLYFFCVFPRKGENSATQRFYMMSTNNILFSLQKLWLFRFYLFPNLLIAVAVLHFKKWF